MKNSSWRYTDSFTVWDVGVFSTVTSLRPLTGAVDALDRRLHHHPVLDLVVAGEEPGERLSRRSRLDLGQVPERADVDPEHGDVVAMDERRRCAASCRHRPGTRPDRVPARTPRARVRASPRPVASASSATRATSWPSAVEPLGELASADPAATPGSCETTSPTRGHARRCARGRTEVSQELDVAPCSGDRRRHDSHHDRSGPEKRVHHAMNRHSPEAGITNDPLALAGLLPTDLELRLDQDDQIAAPPAEVDQIGRNGAQRDEGQIGDDHVTPPADLVGDRAPGRWSVRAPTPVGPGACARAAALARRRSPPRGRRRVAGHSR